MPKRISEETQQAVINDYNNNMSISDISKKYNISCSTVYKIKKQNNISDRYKAAHITDYSDDDINNIIDDYKNGTPKIDICIKYNMSDYMLYKILRGNNITYNRRAKLTKEQEQLAIQMYLDGHLVKEICKKCNINRSKLERIISNNNIPRRQPSKLCKITDINIINKIIDDYNNTDLLTIEICEKYGISPSTLNTLLRKNNIPIRKPIKRNKYKDSDIINDYKNNISLIDIAIKYNICENTVYSILRRNNIKLNIYRWE